MCSVFLLWMKREQFLPLYLRFVKGVLDSNDISLNVSREILQKDPTVDSMKKCADKTCS